MLGITPKMTVDGFNIIFPMSIVGIIADTVPSMPFGLQYRIKIFYSGFSILYKALTAGFSGYVKNPDPCLADRGSQGCFGQLCIICGVQGV
jgi:hypothetical protein